MIKKNVLNKIIEEGLKKIKDESKEGMGAGSAGGYEAKLGMWEDDEVAKKEYKRMEGEFKEATSSSSVGAYDAPGFEDVLMRGNHPIGRGRSFRKPQVKGGEFVTFDKKCKTFPYCSQGDSKDKPVKTTKTLSKNRRKKQKSPLSEAIENVSFKTGLSVEEIKKIILSKINDNL
jgi:hypothetical protein